MDTPPNLVLTDEAPTKASVVGLGCIILVLLPVTFLMHGYWSETDPMQRLTQRLHFHNNIALLGAALMLMMVSHPWPLSINAL
jgi:putative oxidoreductase